jgi:hypothetical protein
MDRGIQLEPDGWGALIYVVRRITGSTPRGAGMLMRNLTWIEDKPPDRQEQAIC